jgi:putative ABC transport system permease protein
MESLLQDLRLAFRVLKKSPGATALCVLSIGLGIGLTTAMFSIGDAMLLRPLPIDRPGELWALYSRADDGRTIGYGWPDYLDMAEASRGWGTLAAYQRRGGMLAGQESNEPVLVSPVTPNFFSLVGMRAALGTTETDAIDGRYRVVLGHRLWRRRFAGDPAIVGKTVVISSEAYVVAGVMPEEFASLQRGVVTDVWMSVDAWFVRSRGERTARNGQFELIVRLNSGAAAPRAAAALDASIRGAGKHKPAPEGSPGTWLRTEFAPGWTKDLALGGGLALILIAVLFVACANATQLRLAQAESRRDELGMRMALGAGGWRLARQLLVETGLVAIAGAASGLLLAWILMRKTTEFISATVVYLDPGIRLDARVFAFVLGALVLSVMFAGLSPARHAARLNIAEVLKSGHTGSARGAQKKVLIVGQVAVSVALFGMAVLFVISLRNAAAIRPGLDPQKRLFVLNVLRGLPLEPTAWAEQAAEQLASVPGVRGVTFARRLPLSGSGGGMTTRVEMPDRPPMAVKLNNVAGNYFSMMGTRVVAGRGIDHNDRDSTPPVVVVSQTLARQMAIGSNPVGDWLKVGGKMRQVVGIAEDGPSNSIHEQPAPFLFLPYAQAPSDDLALMVETAGEPAALDRPLRQALKRFDPHSEVWLATTLRKQLDEALSQDSIMAAVATFLGIFGVMLTGAGLFGLMQYAVSRRTRELGVRMALGARPQAIQRMVLAEALRIAAWGVPIGLGLLAAGQSYARSIVLGISTLEMRTYAFSAAAALVLTLAAAWLPAHRATRIDPMKALRSE